MNITLTKSNIGRFMAISIASLAVVFSLPGVAGASAMYQGRNNELPSIVGTAVAINQKTGEFSTLIAAASCTDIAGILSQSRRDYTLFAPTDAAFAKLKLNAANVCSAFDEHTLTNILEYHIARGKKPAERVLARNRLFMLNNQKAYIVGATIDGQNIIKTDVYAGNGIIHVIDGVMLP